MDATKLEGLIAAARAARAAWRDADASAKEATATAMAASDEVRRADLAVHDYVATLVDQGAKRG